MSAVALFLGAFVQINPVWLYGPYVPYQVSAPAQPDWFVGWLDGALRLGPPWLLRISHYAIPPQFWPGVLMPAVLFALLYLYPFLEARAMKDRSAHHLLDRARDAPVRSGIGFAVLAYALVLLMAGSDDIQARVLHVPIESFTTLYRVLVIVAPVLAGLIGYRVCRELRAREPLLAAHPPAERLVRTATGGYEEEPVRQ